MSRMEKLRIMEIQVTKEIRHDKMIKQRGEGGMTVRFMITAVMGVLLLGWVISAESSLSFRTGDG